MMKMMMPTKSWYAALATDHLMTTCGLGYSDSSLLSCDYLSG